MKTIFPPSKFDNKNIYYVELDAEESVILMHSRIYKMNQKLLKKGAKHKHVHQLERYLRADKI